MRTLLLATTLTLAFAPAVQATPVPSLTYPEPGTFCGFMTLCDAEADKAKEPGEAS